MQMKALRSLNFEKLSSSNSTRDVYRVTSTSAGTPAGYCLSQMRSMGFPLPVCLPVSGREALFWAVLSNAAAHGKRLRATGISLTRTGPSERPKSSSGVRCGGGLLIHRIGLAGRALRRRLGLGGSGGLFPPLLDFWPGIGLGVPLQAAARIGLFRNHPRPPPATWRRLHPGGH